MQGNMLLELTHKKRAYTEGYRSPFDHGQGDDPSTILTDLQHAEHREFAPLFADVGFKILMTPIPGQGSLSQMIRTMPSSSLYTMLSVWKGMCGLS